LHSMVGNLDGPSGTGNENSPHWLPYRYYQTAIDGARLTAFRSCFNLLILSRNASPAVGVY
jgi:hypothetical protein